MKVGDDSMNAEDNREENELYKPPPPVYYGFAGEFVFVLGEVALIVLYGTCTTYKDYAGPNSGLSVEFVANHV